ncbi:MAG: hypothetical protein G4V63_19930 [Candidatus Afipia apatlaquensis]|uniref:Uncharacterized protein n=1 Tax=Candidatus Afipia apatlaquensis TaxID=2712852 RepID=A0A7C9VHP0_9BRAD|nr:hypothetical protein [Candidatus Afipia apatlaquensis]
MDSEYIRTLSNSSAYLPCYIQGIGKCTKVLSKTGEEIVLSYSVNKIIKDSCAINLKDIESIRYICSNITGRSKIFPIFINENLLYMPIKAVKPFIKGDPCMGYINIHDVIEYDFDNKSVKLSCGKKIKYLENSETIKKRIGCCSIIKEGCLQFIRQGDPVYYDKSIHKKRELFHLIKI